MSIAAHFAPDSPYHETIAPTYWSAVRALIKNSRAACEASPTGAELWSRTYTSGTNDEPAAIAVSPDGSKLFVIGTSSA